MEFNGEDKKIRVWFCELKREGERTAPLFATTWNSAEAEFHRTGRRPLGQSSANLLRFATAVLVVSLLLAATILLAKSLRRQPQNFAKQPAATEPGATSEGPLQSDKAPAGRESGKPTERLVAIRRSVRVKKSSVAFAQPARPVKQDGQNGLSQWQSPTAALLRSNTDELLRFAPQMNESAEKMKKFLANDLN